MLQIKIVSPEVVSSEDYREIFPDLMYVHDRERKVVLINDKYGAYEITKKDE